MKKRISSILLALCMMLALLPVTALAADTSGKCGPDAAWSYANGTLTISGTGPMDDWNWETNDGHAPWDAYRNEIRTIVVKPGITTIGRAAFTWCGNLTDVTLPDTVTSIETGAFAFCGSLESIKIPDGVAKIGSEAFRACSSLKSIELPDSVTEIGSYAFYYCSAATSLKLPAGIKTIPDAAFQACSFAKLDIPGNVEAIGSNAFAYCRALTSVSIPAGVKTIGREAFNHCTAIASVTLPDGLEAIGVGAFHNNKTTSVTVPASVKEIGDKAFGFGETRAVAGYTVKGYAGTAAEEYARHMGLAFEYLGEKPVPSASKFADVAEGAYYFDAVSWAVDKNITSGTGATTFSPDQTCTRGQIATFLYRALA